MEEQGPDPSVGIDRPTPHDIFIEMINRQKQKEEICDIWKNSLLSKLK